jgi:hypothetical protein
MTAAAVLRLYEEFIEAADRAARSMDTDRRHVAQLESDICAQLANQPGGVIVIGQVEFRLFIVTMGKEERLSYFKVTVTRERIPDDGGHTFARRKTDIHDPVIPVSAQRRRHEVVR